MKLTILRMNHAGKFEPNRYNDAQKWGEEVTKMVDGLLGFSLTDKQKKEISMGVVNRYGDIVEDERNDICAELQKEAGETSNPTERAAYLAIVKSIKRRGRQ